jgi:hypothetical protein
VTCEQRQDLLLLYATDALDAAETAEVRQHLQTGCPTCAGFLAEAQAVIMSVPMGLDRITPPPGLKERLMRRIDADLADSSTADTSTAKFPRQTPLRPAHESGGGTLSLLKYLIPTALAAGVAIVATRSLMMRQMNDLQQKAAAAVIDAQQLQQLRGEFQSQTQVVEMLGQPGLKLIPLSNTPQQPKAVANLLWDQKKQQWAILTSGMTPAPSGQTYELWFVTQAGEKIPAGTFDVNSAGTASLCVPIPKGIGGLKLAAVTNEKTGGSTQPTGQFQVLGSVE